MSTTAGEVRQGSENARLYYLFDVPNINIERANEKAEFILTQLDRHLSDRQWLEFAFFMSELDRTFYHVRDYAT